jgi:hypothetical protein
MSWLNDVAAANIALILVTAEVSHEFNDWLNDVDDFYELGNSFKMLNKHAKQVYKYLKNLHSPYSNFQLPKYSNYLIQYKN